MNPEGLQKFVEILDATYPDRVARLREKYGDNLAEAFIAKEDNVLVSFDVIIDELLSFDQDEE